jgi:hypothetical protein
MSTCSQLRPICQLEDQYITVMPQTLMTKLATAMPINLALGSGEIKLRLHVSYKMSWWRIARL